MTRQLSIFIVRPLLYDWLVSQDADWAHAALVQLDALTEQGIFLDLALRQVCEPLIGHAAETGMVWVIRRAHPSHPKLVAHRLSAVDRLACGSAAAPTDHPYWAMAHADGVVEAFNETRLHVCKQCLRGAP